MERNEKTQSILRQFKKKSKRVVNNNIFTEFFYLNKERRVVEFLAFDEDTLIIENFIKEFLPKDFKDFVNLKILNDMEEESRIWYYDTETLVMVISVNWGFKKQEISIDIDIENFMITVIDESGLAIRALDPYLLNDYLISFLSIQAKNLSETFDVISKKKD